MINVMNSIKIFMCCHRSFKVVPPLCIPIQGGTALNEAIDGALPDNMGVNISAKNREYCELTAHYYAWKNEEAEYYGFCHYRRFFCADEDVVAPYLVKGRLNADRLQGLLGSEEYWRELICSFDIIAPRSEDMGLSAREHYITSKCHYAEDLQLFVDILSVKAPFLADATEEYLGQNRQYFCNMFIMDKKHFFEYCDVLFAVLEEFDKRKTLHGDFQSDRTDGYLGEIFTGIYIYYCRKNGARIKELPRLDVFCPLKKRLGCALLPSESRRRFFVKRLVKKIRGN